MSRAAELVEGNKPRNKLYELNIIAQKHDY
jgi:hypothetical protein